MARPELRWIMSASILAVTGIGVEEADVRCTQMGKTVGRMHRCGRVCKLIRNSSAERALFCIGDKEPSRRRRLSEPIRIAPA